MKRNAILGGIIVISWLIVLSVLPLREMFLAQTFRVDSKTSILPAAIPRPVDIEPLYVLPITPDSPEMKGFPDDPVALATAIQEKLNKMEVIRLGGELSDADLRQHQQQGIPSPERKKEKPNYTREQWQRVISWCKRGQQLAPDNAFFDVMEAYWQFAEFHDEAAWSAMRRASKKPLFDYYEKEQAERRINERESTLGRRLFWEESLDYMVFLRGGFYPGMREMWRWMAWEGIKAQRNGEEKKALEIYLLALGVSQLWVDSSTDSHNFLVADVSNNIILRAQSYANIRPDEGIKGRERTHSIFTNYAKSIRRPDLLRYVEASEKNQKQLRQCVDLSLEAGERWTANAAIGAVLWSGGVALLFLLAGSAIAGLLAAGTKVLLRGHRTEKPVPEQTLWRSALSFTAFPAALVILIPFIDFFQNTYRKADHYAVVASGLYSIASPAIDPRAVITLYSTAIVFGAAFCLKRAALMHRKTDAPKVLLWQQVLSVIGSIIFMIGWYALAFDRWPFYIGDRFLSHDGEFIAPFFDPRNFGLEQYTDAIGFGAAIVICGIALFLFGQYCAWRQTDDIKSTFTGFLHLMSGGALRWCALGSVLYLLTLCLALPARAPLENYTKMQIQKGEIAALEMQ